MLAQRFVYESQQKNGGMMTTIIQLRLFLSFTLAAGLLASPFAHTETIRLSTELAGAESMGTGTVIATHDTETMMLTWTVEYEDLSGAPGAMHFHGPAAPGDNAGVALPLSGDLASPIHGSATLTSEQAADLLAGRWYLNVHTAKVRGGEVRGQLTKD